jgi:hypothetical protein
MGGSAELFESPESKQASFPRLSLDQFDLRDVRATMPTQNRIYGPHANEQLQGSVDLNKIREQNFPVYDIDKDPKMDPFRTQRTQLAPKIPLGENFDLKVAGPTNFSLRKSWKF